MSDWALIIAGGFGAAIVSLLYQIGRSIEAEGEKTRRLIAALLSDDD